MGVTEQWMVKTKILMSANLNEWTIIHFVSKVKGCCKYFWLQTEHKRAVDNVNSVNTYFDCISVFRHKAFNKKGCYCLQQCFISKSEKKSEQVNEEVSLIYIELCFPCDSPVLFQQILLYVLQANIFNTYLFFSSSLL